MPTKVEISYKTIVFVVLFLIFIRFIVQIKEIIFLIFVAFILMSAFKPWTDILGKRGIPRPLSVLIIYIVFLGLLVFAGSSIFPPLVTQSIHLGESFPLYLKTVLPFVTIDSTLITQQIGPIGESIVKVTVGLFSNLITLFTLIVVSFYMLIERNNLEQFLSSFLGKEGAVKILTVIRKVEERLGAWVRGQVGLAFTIGIATFIGLLLLNIPYALPLAIFAGILEIVPTIGPIISAVPAIFIAVTISPLVAILVALLYFIIQQAENHLVVPLVMKRVIGLPPLVTILAILIGAKLSGIGGALLAIPMVVTIETVVSEYFKLKESPKEDIKKAYGSS